MASPWVAVAWWSTRPVPWNRVALPVRVDLVAAVAAATGVVATAAVAAVVMAAAVVKAVVAMAVVVAKAVTTAASAALMALRAKVVAVAAANIDSRGEALTQKLLRELFLRLPQGPPGLRNFWQGV